MVNGKKQQTETRIATDGIFLIRCSRVVVGWEVLSEKKPWGFPGGVSAKEPACQCRRCKRHRFDHWVGKIPWRGAQQPTPVFLPGESHGQRSLVGYNT